MKIPFLSNMDKLTVANSMAIFTFVPPCTKEQGCLSTLEAVAEALLALEGDRGPKLKELLLQPFGRMVELQMAFIGDQDKNIPEEQTTTKFDREAALLDLQQTMEAEDGSAEPKEIFCILRWGQRAVPERPIIVVELFAGSGEAAKLRAQECSEGRPRGLRCWARQLEDVPPGALWEAPPAAMMRKADDG